MALLLRGLRAARAMRWPSSVPVPVGASPQGCVGRRGFHRAALLLQDGSKSDPTDSSSSSSSSSSSASYHQHYQAHPSESDPAASAPEEEFQKPNTSFADQGGEEDEDYETEEQLQDRILTAAVDFVPQHGWTTEAISAGAVSLGLSSASAGIVANGAGDLVLHFIAQCNSQLAKSLAEEHNQIQMGHAEPKETPQFLRDAVEARLRMLTPYIDTWPQAMSILLLPHNIPDSLKHLSTLIDDIWYFAGDRSTDVSVSKSDSKTPSSNFILSPGHQHLSSIRPASSKLNWYTRRAALTGIYNTTELVMLQDSSPDFQETWAFLSNRVQDMMNMADTAKQVQSTGEAVVQGLMGAAVTLKNLAGINQQR